MTVLDMLVYTFMFKIYIYIKVVDSDWLCRNRLVFVLLYLGQAAMNTTSQAGQSVSGATPQRNRPPIHPTSPNFLRHLQENGLLLDFL